MPYDLGYYFQTAMPLVHRFFLLAEEQVHCQEIVTLLNLCSCQQPMYLHQSSHHVWRIAVDTNDNAYTVPPL
jgi:hypothetical protein